MLCSDFSPLLANLFGPHFVGFFFFRPLSEGRNGKSIGKLVYDNPQFAILYTDWFVFKMGEMGIEQL